MLGRFLLVLTILFTASVTEAATWLKQSTAVEIKMGPFVDSTDGVTVEDGLTLSQADVRLAKNGGDWAQKTDANACVHEENGWYRCLLDTTDTGTLGILLVNVSESGALPVWREFQVVHANTYDALVTTGAIPNAVAGAAGGLFIAGTNAATTITSASGAALTLAGTSSAKGLSITTAGADAVSIAPTAGHGINIAANGTSKHGLFVTGGTAGTSDGIKAVAGSGGTDIRGNITGSLSGSVGSVAATSAGITLMAVDALVKDATSVVYTIAIRDSTTGAGMTGLTSASSGLTIAYARTDQGNAAAATCAPASATRGSFTSCGFVEKDATNQPGVYEFGMPNASIATGADLVTFYFSGVSGMIPTILPIALVDTSLNQIYVRQGTPAGASQSADQAAVKTVVDAIKVKTDSLGFTGSNVNAITNAYASGQVPLQPTTAGRTLDVTATGAAGIDWGNVENPTTTLSLSGTTVATVTTATTATNLTNAPTNGDLTATMKTSVTTAATAATPTAAAVTGAVGSVAGNVAGSVLSGVSVAVGAYHKNVAGQAKVPIYMRDDTTPSTPAIGSTLTITVSKDGGAFGAVGGATAEIGNGWYTFAPSQADTNCSMCVYRVTGTNAIDTGYTIHTAP